MSTDEKGFWTKLGRGIVARPMVFMAGCGAGILIAAAIKLTF